MEVHVHIHLDYGSAITSKLDEILAGQMRLEAGMTEQEQQIEELTNSVKALEDATTQLGTDVLSDLDQLKQQLANEGKASPTVLAIIGRIQTNTQKITDLDAAAAAAVSA